MVDNLEIQRYELAFQELSDRIYRESSFVSSFVKVIKRTAFGANGKRRRRH